MRLRRQFRFDERKDLKDRLDSIRWVGMVLDKAGKELWEEVGLTRRVLG